MGLSLFGSRVNANQPDHGFSVGAVYSRVIDIHKRLGGQWQSGISTPKDSPYVILFTSRQGRQHGYFDHYGDDGKFYYYGHGQVGDMQMEGGNRAVRDHQKNGKALLVFLSLGKGEGQRFVGEFVYEDHYVQPNVPDRNGDLRNAIVFRLKAVDDEISDDQDVRQLESNDLVGHTDRNALTTVRTQQGLFRRRVSTLEKGCRLTGIEDLRFLRASHIKPWSVSSDEERVDRNNGLLLTPSADLLFDHGWLSFRDDGRLILASKLPGEIRDKVGIDLREGRGCGNFTSGQANFLAFHRECILGQREYQDQLVTSFAWLAPVRPS
jgi:5-methylcytosine-specific restriction protein A